MGHILDIGRGFCRLWAGVGAEILAIDVPTPVLHGDDDQIVPIAASALLSVKPLKNGTLKVYERLAHGLCTTHAS